MKEPVKIYLNSETKKKLMQKASETGFYGRGALTKFIEKISSEVREATERLEPVVPRQKLEEIYAKNPVWGE